MKLSVAPILAFCMVTSMSAVVDGQEQCSATWTCAYTDTPPTLDADLADWETVDSYETTLLKYPTDEAYIATSTYKCVHDNTKIYFSMEIPGEYRHNATNNKECAAIATMMKIGAQATYLDMGGCPEAKDGCDAGVPEACSPYRVDVGAHWELSQADQGVLYDMNTVNVTGNDVTPANKDDEYAVHSFCRKDDNDAKAGNEWAGAWRHTDPTPGVMGDYIFELSRTLTTASTETDAQLVPGEMIEFGIAYWDPNQTPTGWLDANHYITGCGQDWIALTLEKPPSSTSGGEVTRSFLGFAVSVVSVVTGVVAVLFF